MEQPLSYPQQISWLAAEFARYVRDQTGVAVLDPSEVAIGRLAEAAGRLEIALAQLMDFATVYGSDSSSDLGQFAVPVAALLGEYLQAAAGAVWLEGQPGDFSLLLLRLPDGALVELTSTVRSMLGGGVPNLAGYLEQFEAVEEAGQADERG
jgi:hypothetical protein